MKTKIYTSAGTRQVRHKPLPLVGIMAMLLVGLTGCATVYRTTPGSLTSIDYKGANDTPLEQVYITTTGYHFLWTVPLFSGDLRWNEEKQSINGGTCLFSDQVGADELQNALLKIAERRNCDVIDIRERKRSHRVVLWLFAYGRVRRVGAEEGATRVAGGI